MIERRPGPHIVVLSSLFPCSTQPGAGLFVRERMFRVGERMPVAVVSPKPWFPLQGLLRLLRPGSRPPAPEYEQQRGHDVWFPRFLSLPLVLRRLDGFAMALACYSRLRALKRADRLDILDAHFGYPDGFAAMLLGRWLHVPVTLTLRGTEHRHSGDPGLRPLLLQALRGVQRLFTVSDSLRRLALSLGADPEKTLVIGNGVDLMRFYPLDKAEQRRKLGLPAGAKVLVTVGGLVERKGFHRVIELLPALKKEFCDLRYLVVGGPSPEGDWTEHLRKLAANLGVTDLVHFAGAVEQDELREYLSAGDVFVLASSNEGWANVLLEAMACGLPVVATRVGGNEEVVCSPALGIVVPFGEPAALLAALNDALAREWNGEELRRYARSNTWDERVAVLECEFRALCPGAIDEPSGNVRSLNSVVHR